MTKILPCPFCGQTPDINDDAHFKVTQGGKWGSLVCCCEGPEVRTGYQELSHWKAAAIEEWNTRVPKL